MSMALLALLIVLSVSGTISSTASTIMGLLMQHTYLGIFFLMILESASLPIPSEVILPAVGFLAARGQISLFLGIAAAILGSMIGILIDYYIAYFLGKAFVYKHLDRFHIKKSTILAFEKWFEKNGAFAVFISREIPIVRGLISFPAGFARMPLGPFLFYSVAGTAIWDVVLTLFGYYALDTTSLVYAIAAIAALLMVLYVVYVYGIRKVRRASDK